jgi:uncharacterized protein YdhG (YjbR/CyaY superfamily)
MQSTATTVDDYLGEAPAERLAALTKLRRLCRTHLPGFAEEMRHGMPAYSRDGVVEVAFASQKQNIALYITRKDVLDAHRHTFPTSALGKGCIRFRNPATIDFAIVRTLLEGTAGVTGEVS